MAAKLRFQDKVAIVTGGCKGIGRGCVDVFGMSFIFRFYHMIALYKQTCTYTINCSCTQCIRRISRVDKHGIDMSLFDVHGLR